MSMSATIATSAASASRTQAPAVWTCGSCGAELDAVCDPLQARCVDAAFVITRLEQAGATLLAMRIRSPFPPASRCALPDVLHDAVLSYGWTNERMRPAIPDAAAITRMDATLNWLGLIPQSRHVLRRIVAARALVNPLTGKHLVPWKRLGDLMRADYRATQRWHARGIDGIVEGLGGTVQRPPTGMQHRRTVVQNSNPPMLTW